MFDRKILEITRYFNEKIKLPLNENNISVSPSSKLSAFAIIRKISRSLGPFSGVMTLKFSREFKKIGDGSKKINRYI